MTGPYWCNDPCLIGSAELEELVWALRLDTLEPDFAGITDLHRRLLMAARDPASTYEQGVRFRIVASAVKSYIDAAAMADRNREVTDG